MTPGARVAAAIAVLDRIDEGEAAEKALTNWARGARYAGSKDRAAVRDHVFDALRRWRSSAALGGAETGRGRMIGLLRDQGLAPDTLFTGEGHAPGALQEDERTAGAQPDGPAAADMPDWLWPILRDDLGEAAAPVAEALRHRAPVFARANLLRATRDEALVALGREGIEARPAKLSGTGLEITGGARRLARSDAFTQGLVELQDASSQAVVEALPLKPGQRVLDYCAGGGGKALAMAARLRGPVDVHDADKARMRDLPQRAARAGADLRPVEVPQGPYDLVLCDVPCSGSGAWRRAPEGKWRLTAGTLAALGEVQARILAEAAPRVAPDGVLAYATCSVLRCENDGPVEAFCTREGWTMQDRRVFLPGPDGDGFYLAVLKRQA
jgi:16S rRNA (cytosine967-C5)-methyltransferase